MLPPHPPFPSPPPPPAGVSVREIALMCGSFTIALPFVVVFFICMLRSARQETKCLQTCGAT